MIIFLHKATKFILTLIKKNLTYYLNNLKKVSLEEINEMTRILQEKHFKSGLEF